jgi:hypothetical protein
MTQDLCGRPLDADFADADLAGGIHYRRPGVIRQGDAVLGALGPGFSLGIAGNQHRIGPDHRPGGADEVAWRETSASNTWEVSTTLGSTWNASMPLAKRRPPEVAPVPVSAPFGSFCRHD